MTLGEFLEAVSDNRGLLLAYFLGIPFIALLALFFSKGHSHLSPWKYLYTVLIYMVCIPGIFAVSLTVYLFLFERRPIMETDLFNQILPIFSMVVTLILIRKQVDLDMVPGFDKISGLITILAVLIGAMWVIDKTHIYSITFVPFYVVIAMLVGGYLLVQAGFKKLST